uniref:Uncharacterized protein n=1 Tax=Panagrolaimus sp. JU765 TaxID=591449 RepID=A0AC34PUY3_9BILA
MHSSAVIFCALAVSIVIASAQYDLDEYSAEKRTPMRNALVRFGRAGMRNALLVFPALANGPLQFLTNTRSSQNTRLKPNEMELHNHLCDLADQLAVSTTCTTFSAPSKKLITPTVSDFRHSIVCSLCAHLRQIFLIFVFQNHGNRAKFLFEY